LSEAAAPAFHWRNIMSHNAQRIASNVTTHGHLFAVQTEVARFKRMGCSAGRAFALAMSNVFGRFVA
jgi:hypothetical protein